MQIERIQVEEGFLDGLDLRFKPGLNVLIGPRGTGKTSVIELIRFCLGVQAITDSQDELARAHALAILGSGTVAVTLTNGEDRIRVVRAAEDEVPRAQEEYPVPLVVSQNEIEEIGLRSESRLGLIDHFLRPEDLETQSASEGMTESLTRQIASLRGEVEKMRGELAGLASVPAQLAELATEQDKLKRMLSASEPDRQALDELSKALALTKARGTVIESSKQTVAQWIEAIAGLTSTQIELDPWPEEDPEGDWLGSVRSKIKKAEAAVEKAEAYAVEVRSELIDLARKNRATSADLDDRARILRKKLDQVRQGAGDVTKRLQELESRKSRLAALQATINSKLEQIERLKRRRDKELDALDAKRERRFAQRRGEVSRLNKTLRPLVKIDIEHAARHAKYVSAIASALRGSGAKYNIWSPKIAAALSPRELVSAIESGSPEVLAESVPRLSTDQASRLLAVFDPERLGPILTSEVEDEVTFSLFDGSEYKSTSSLSTGQRCTVVLPILLRQAHEPLIVDQPEDHLDNAFIVETLVSGILEQKKNTQIICSTHNANIPVLGDAELVIAMGSDGTRAFVSHAAPLVDKKSVKAITTIMEGGLAAFKKRAEFYGSVRIE